MHQRWHFNNKFKSTSSHIILKKTDLFKVNVKSLSMQRDEITICQTPQLCSCDSGSINHKIVIIWRQIYQHDFRLQKHTSAEWIGKTKCCFCSMVQMKINWTGGCSDSNLGHIIKIKLKIWKMSDTHKTARALTYRRTATNQAWLKFLSVLWWTWGCPSQGQSDGSVCRWSPLGVFRLWSQLEQFQSKTKFE